LIGGGRDLISLLKGETNCLSFKDIKGEENSKGNILRGSKL
jgi:hypothetical protein